MRQLKGFTAKGKEDWVWQLCQTLYGLRQSGRVWYQKLRDALLELGFTPSAADPCLHPVTRRQPLHRLHSH